MKHCIRCPSFALNIDPAEEKCDVCYYKDMLLDLLAVIHRDGGQYTEKWGIVKSVENARNLFIYPKTLTLWNKRLS